MPKKKTKLKSMTSGDIRRSYLEFFEARGHTIIPSMSLVPGGDKTLLFTNSGMVQFKDVFLGTGSRPYTRAVDTQKCMRVAGKHNDLDDVGRDDSHHTFFEMLGNWSFGDYYQEEAIGWAWELLTEVWKLPKDRIWATVFEDELGEIPRDDEAAESWLKQPGFKGDQLLFFGREENFWEMAETGPCGPDSEIFYDRGPEYCDKDGEKDHTCEINGNCQRFLELWNLVFIQYNRSSPTNLQPLPAKHVDTGMGFERMVSVLQDVDSNYKTDLFTPLLDTVQDLAHHSEAEREEHFTAYRVIGDHARAASFLIADGVVPGNIGRNYVSRMIIRRGSRFGSSIGLNEPFMAEVAKSVIDEYGEAYPELLRNRKAILQTLTEEETRFHRTVDTGVTYLKNMMDEIEASGSSIIPGKRSFDLYATYGLPLEITRDIARESGFEVDEPGFREAMEAHRLTSGGGRAIGELTEENISIYQNLLVQLKEAGKLEPNGVSYDPYALIEMHGPVIAILKEGELVEEASSGEGIEMVIPSTPFYVEAGGQVSDTGTISSLNDKDWEFRVEEAREPVQGLIIHSGAVVDGAPHIGDNARAEIDLDQRMAIMRNHTATHLLHGALHVVLGEHARQAGSLVAPDRLRFDFTHPEAVTPDELVQIERWVVDAILANYELVIQHQSQKEAIDSGAMALFGETYGEQVRTISIGGDKKISYELCGGTHVPETGVIGPFLIISEGSVAAGIRRIEAVTGFKAQERIREQLAQLKRISDALGVPTEELDDRIMSLIDERDDFEKRVSSMRNVAAMAAYRALKPSEVGGIPFLTAHFEDADPEILRSLTDRFREDNPTGVAVFSTSSEDKPLFIAAVSEDLVARGLHAGNLVKEVSKIVGGGGGGKPDLAQAGGNDMTRLDDALDSVSTWIERHLK